MIRVLERSATPPVTVDEALEYCRAPSDDAAAVTRALAAAVEFVEKATSLALVPTTFQYRDSMCYWPLDGGLELPRAPVRAVGMLEYSSAEGVFTELDTTLWVWEKTDEGATVVLKEASNFDTWFYQDGRDNVYVTFEAGYDTPGSSGYGDDPSLVVPPTAVIAVLMMTQNYYDNRGVTMPQQSFPVPYAIDALINRLRVYR